VSISLVEPADAEVDVVALPGGIDDRPVVEEHGAVGLVHAVRTDDRVPCQDSNVKRRSLPRIVFPPPLRLHLHGVFTSAGPTSSAVSRRTVPPHALKMPVLQPPSMPRALTLRTWSPEWGPMSTVVVWPGLF
jgi:hypothetical protein